MARQSGHLPLRGTIGNVTYRETQDGSIAQQKTSLTRDQVLTDPAFENSRGSSHEFGTASTGAGILIRLFKPALLNCCDNRVHGRLLRRLMKVIEKDMVSKKGERNFLSGDIRELRGFWWNRHAGIEDALGAHYNVSVDREAGEARFNIPSLIPKQALKGNPTATHYRIIVSAAEVDWKDNGRAAKVQATDYLPYDKKETAPFAPVLLITEGGKVPVVSCLSICWYQKIAGEMNVMMDKRYNAAGVIGVDTP
jgi:hypothetical protein